MYLITNEVLGVSIFCHLHALFHKSHQAVHIYPDAARKASSPPVIQHLFTLEND